MTCPKRNGSQPRGSLSGNSRLWILASYDRINDPMMIAGTMAKWQQYGHRAPLLIVPLFGAFIWWGFHTAPSPSQARNSFAIILLIVLALIMIGAVLRFGKKIVKEFTYDGRTFTFNTLASPEMQMRDLSAIEQVADWSGRGGPLGFCIKFRDGAKLYLHSGVSNAAALAERMRCDLGSSALDNIAAARHRPARLALLMVVAISAGLMAALATSRLLQRLPPEISRTEFLSEVNHRHVDKVVIRDRALISGTSSTRGAFRVRMRVDDVLLNDLRSQGVAVEFKTSTGVQ